MGFRSRLGKALRSVVRAVEGPPRTGQLGINFKPLEPGQDPLELIGRDAIRDKPIGETIAPLPARQVWELHRARDASRQLSLTSSLFKSFLTWSVDATLGHEPLQLRWAVPKDQQARLRDVQEAIREEWARWQLRPLGGSGETLMELCAHALWTRLVDGDCFLVPYRGRGGELRIRVYEGDALAETAFGTESGRERVLGVERNRDGGPVAYYFAITDGSGGVYAYSLPYAQEKSVRMGADRVWHIFDRRIGGGRARGNPWCTEVLEEIARLDEFYGAFIRGEVTRASIAVALQQDPELGAEDTKAVGPGRYSGDVDGEDESGTEARRRYQEFKDRAGSFFEISPGFTATSINTGSPSSQAAQTVAMMERRVCGGLGVSPSTILGDYSSVSFSAGQLLRAQEASTVKRFQAQIRRQILRRVFYRFFVDRWSTWLADFPRLMPEDRAILEEAIHVLPKYQVLDQARTLQPVVAAFEGGLIDLIEARQMIGYATPDPDAFIATVLDQLKAMGKDPESQQPEPPGQEDEGDEGEDEDEGDGETDGDA